MIELGLVLGDLGEGLRKWGFALNWTLSVSGGNSVIGIIIDLI